MGIYVYENYIYFYPNLIHRTLARLGRYSSNFVDIILNLKLIQI